MKLSINIFLELSIILPMTDIMKRCDRWRNAQVFWDSRTRTIDKLTTFILCLAKAQYYNMKALNLNNYTVLSLCESVGVVGNYNWNLFLSGPIITIEMVNDLFYRKRFGLLPRIYTESLWSFRYWWNRWSKSASIKSSRNNI